MAAVDELLAAYREVLNIPESCENVVRIPFATLLGFRFGGIAPWLYVIGASGGMKSTILRSMRAIPDVLVGGEYMGAGAIVSGYVGPALRKAREKARKDSSKTGKLPLVEGSPYSLASYLNGRCWIIHDFTQFTGNDRNSTARLQGTLRILYDGEQVGKFGNDEGAGAVYKAHFSLIAGVTPEVDRFRSSQSPLGERFVGFRFHQPSHEDARAAVSAAIQGGDRRWMDALPDRIAAILARVPRIPLREIIFPEEITDRIVGLSICAAWLRTTPSKTYRGSIPEYEYSPVPERGTRVGKQIALITAGHAILSGRTSVTEEDVERVARELAWGSVPQRVLSITEAVYKRKVASTVAISEDVRLPSETVRSVCDDLGILGVFQKMTVDRYRCYSLADDFKDIAEPCRFFREDHP